MAGIMRAAPRYLVLAAFVINAASLALAQGAPGNSVSTPPGSETTTQLAVPGGAGATLTPSGTAAAGPILGFQVWQQDKFFISSFFTFSVPQTFSGQPPAPPQTVSPQQGSFGALLLNPPGQGTSYSFTGNRMWGVYPTTGLKACTATKPQKDSSGNVMKNAAGVVQRTSADCTVADAYFFFGSELRGGITNASWTESTAIPVTVGSSVAYMAPELLVTSKTYNFVTNGNQNQYQFGAAAGPSFRFLGGDVAQAENSAFRNSLLGTTKTKMSGFELTFFVRMNQFKPYVRYTHFAPSAGNNIAGFSGSQFTFGVDVLSPLFQTTLTQ